jgi:hypothetical protein
MIIDNYPGKAIRPELRQALININTDYFSWNKLLIVVTLKKVRLLFCGEQKTNKPYLNCNGLINQDTSKDRFIMSLEVKYEQSNQTKKT